MNKKVKQLNVKVSDIEKVKNDVFLLQFTSPYIAKVSNPGNFLHIKIEPTILRRPLSIHKIQQDKVYILFRVRGKGTKALSQMQKGDVLDIIGPLGNGFSCDRRAAIKKRRILIAGGLGVAPLVFLGQRLRESSNKKLNPEIRNVVLLGAKNKAEVLCEEEFKKIGFKPYIATEDGSKGLRGTVIDLLKEILTTYHLPLTTEIYACGPKEMFYQIHKLVKRYPRVNCQVSFEQFMGCGLGICCGCVIETKHGHKKVCKDGPVFGLKEAF